MSFIGRTNIEKVTIEGRPLSNKTESRIRHTKGPAHGSLSITYSPSSFCKSIQGTHPTPYKPFNTIHILHTYLYIPYISAYAFFLFFSQQKHNLCIQLTSSNNFRFFPIWMGFKLRSSGCQSPTLNT